jgi:hypothetical protein
VTGTPGTTGASGTPGTPGPPGAKGTPQRSLRAFKRLVDARVEEARARLAAAGIDVEIHAGWSLDRRSLIVRCSVLRAGEVDPVAREQSAFAGGYLLRHLADLGVRPQFKGNARHLLVPYPGSAAAAAA